MLGATHGKSTLHIHALTQSSTSSSPLHVQKFLPSISLPPRPLRLPALRPPAANPLRLGALQVAGGDPALVVGLGAGGDGRAVGADDGHLVGRVDLLGLAGGALRALAALAAAALLREERRDPGVVDEVAGAAERGGEEEVEEDAVFVKSEGFSLCSTRWAQNSHLRVEEADGRLDDADGLVVDLLGVDLAGGALEDGGEVEAQVLRVHLGREGVGEALALAGGDGDAVALRGQVAQDDGHLGRAGHVDGRRQRAAHDQHLHRLGLLVVHVEHRARRVPVDQLHAEDLGLREGGRDVDVQVGRLLLGRLLDIVLDLFDLGVGG